MSQQAIAEKIRGNIDQLVGAWSVAVRQDPRIKSDETLTLPELIDHVPAILEEICALIRKDEKPDVRNVNEARVNVYTRFHQGYKGRDLVRELSLLRITLLDYLMDVSMAEPGGFNIKEWHTAATILNLYLDEEIRYAISVFSASSITDPGLDTPSLPS
jgi:hypothetical protein